MNANNGTNNRIPFYPDPNLFRKGVRNGEIKESRSNELKLKIVFFGEIEFNKKNYYKYACYYHDGKIHYLQLTTRVVNPARRFVATFENPQPLMLSFSSVPNRTKLSAMPKNVNKMIPKQNFTSNKQELVVVKISKHKVEYNLTEILPYFSFRPDPNGIELSELEKKRSDSLFKIIRKSKLFSLKFDEPIILFGEIEINGKTYYQYCCYKSRGIGSEDGVSFRKLSNDSGDLNKFRNKTNINNQYIDSKNRRPYLYYIKISDIQKKLLRELLNLIELVRRNKNNQSLFKTIYNQVHHFLNQNNVQFNEEGGIELQNMGPTRVNKRLAFNGNPQVFMKKESDTDIKRTFSKSYNLIPFFGEIDINGQKYYRYACYIIDGVIYFITLQEQNNKQNKLKVVMIDRNDVQYDLDNLFKELNSSLNQNKAILPENTFNMYKTSISEMCRLLDIQDPTSVRNNNRGRRN